MWEKMTEIEEPTEDSLQFVFDGHIYLMAVNNNMCLFSVATGGITHDTWHEIFRGSLPMGYDGGEFIPAIRSGNSQVEAGAVKGEIWIHKATATYHVGM
jgi:hypothetical protein